MSIIDDIVIISRRNMVLGFALLIAAEEAYYKDEIVDMGMKDLLIGEEKKLSSKKDWIEKRVENWIEDAKDKLGEK